jgi:hypothetical protein
MARIDLKKQPSKFQVSYLDDLIWKTYKTTGYIMRKKPRNAWEYSRCIGNIKNILKDLDILNYIK